MPKKIAKKKIAKKKIAKKSPVGDSCWEKGKKKMTRPDSASLPARYAHARKRRLGEIDVFGPPTLVE